MRIIKYLAGAAAGWLSIITAVAGPGALDPSYNPVLGSGTVYGAALQPNGELVIGGNFSTVGGVSRNRIARLYSNGSLDSGFLNGLSGVSGTVYCLAVEGDGRIVIGGNFTSVNGTTRYGVARLNTNGSLDGSFVPGYSYSYYPAALVVQSDNRVIMGGGTQGNSFLYRLNADGSYDTTFASNVVGNASSSSPVYALALQPDGKVIVGGSFSSVAGVPCYNVARLNTDGSVDAGFTVSVPSIINSAVRCAVVQPDGKILIGGDFDAYAGRSYGHVIRLSSTGALDTNFTASSSLSGSVYALALQTNNCFLAGGNFSYYNGPAYDYDLARCYPDGTIDTNFQANFNSSIYTVAVQSDGGILAGGSFYTTGGQSRYGLARVYGDLYPPQFISQPTNLNVAVGTNVTFTAIVGNPTLTYFQWLKNGNAIPGATGVSYSLYNVQLADAGTYAVSASNGLGGNTSSNAVLTVGIPPQITQPPVSLVVTQGQLASFTVGASGQPLNYLWKKSGVPIAGATNATLTFASTVLANAGSYTCTVTNFLGSQTSSAATLTVYAPPGILTQPVSQTVGIGSNLNLSVTANGTAPLGYQWWKDGALLANDTTASITVTNAQTTDAGGYYVVITNFLGSVTSLVASVSAIDFPPAIISQPAGGAYLVGTNFTLSAAAAGTAPLFWQWNFNGAPLPGANGAGYTVSSAGTNIKEYISMWTFIRRHIESWVIGRRNAPSWATL